MSNTTIDTTSNVEELIKKASRAEKADDAMKFAQAALNAANALAQLDNMKRLTAGDATK